MISEVPAAVLGAIAACALALSAIAYAVLAPHGTRLPMSRRRPAGYEQVSGLTEASTAATKLIGQVLSTRDEQGRIAAAIERAGLKTRTQDFVLIVIAISLALAAVAALLSGPVVALLAALLVPIMAKVWLGMRAGKRRAAFAAQLDDSLQMMAGSMRAGHSLMQALAGVAREAEEPTAEEFARILNETRVGRDTNEALEAASKRMECDDFMWAVQAIAISRESGGNLAELLDGVSFTIRERNQIKRQVQALSAEGKMSAMVLMLLPFGIGGFLFLFNREYLSGFTSSIIGYGLIVAAVVLLIVGGLWMRKAVQIKF